MKKNSTEWVAKAVAGAVSLLMIGVVVSPVAQNWTREPRDGFPLSHFPMFCRKRDNAVTLTYVVGIDRDGRQHRIPYKKIGTGGLNQVRKQVRKAASDDRADEVCRRVAARIARIDNGPLAEVEVVAVVTAEYPLDEYSSNRKLPHRFRHEAHCRVERH